MVRKEVFMASIYEQIMDNSHIRSVKEVRVHITWNNLCALIW